MPRVCQREGAVIVQVADDRGGEAVVREQRPKKLVQPLHGRCGIAPGQRARSDSILQLFLDHGHHYCGRKTLAGYIAQCEPQTVAMPVGVVEIPGESAGRDGDRVHIHVGRTCGRPEQRQL